MFQPLIAQRASRSTEFARYWRLIMMYHILNGDALAEKWPSTDLPGTIVVIRESFMDGPLGTNLNASYWNRRADFISEYFHADPEDYKAVPKSTADIGWRER